MTVVKLMNHARAHQKVTGHQCEMIDDREKIQGAGGEIGQQVGSPIGGSQEAEKILYIASPYKHPDEKVVEARAKQVAEVTAQITYNFETVAFSPIVYSHYLKDFIPGPVDWYKMDLVYLRKCFMMLVVQIPGWEESYGVSLERDEARKHRIPVIYAKPKEVVQALIDVGMK